MIFVKIYKYFSQHKKVMWTFLVLSVMLMGLLSSKLHMQLDITSFLPDSEETEVVFKNLTLTDRIVVMVSGKDDPYELMDVAEDFKERMWQSSDSLHIKSLETQIDAETYVKTINFIYENFPLYLQEEDYKSLDSLLKQDVCDAKMRDNYKKMTSLMGVGVQEMILKDPLGVGNKTLQKLSSLNVYDEYVILDDYLFSQNYSTLFFFMESKDGVESSDINDELVTTIETTIDSINSELSDIKISYFGSPAVATYNVRQVYSDLILTISIALVTISLLIALVYKRKRTIILLIAPVLYGFLFSLALISVVSGTISVIAIGTGSIILGLALSYSIHVISHSYYAENAEELIKELSYPLTVGSITTIGAFVGLMFTNSSLLQDFGLFAATNIVGTTIFCLVFLPHFLPKNQNQTDTIGLKIINKINDYPFDKNKVLIAILGLLTIIGLFYYNDVGFNSDMMKLNFMPEHLENSKNELESHAASENVVLVVSHNKDADSAIVSYKKTNEVSLKLKGDSCIDKVSSIAEFLLTKEEQQIKLNRWNEFWTQEKKEQAESVIIQSALNNNFKKETFSSFIELINKDYKTQDMMSAVKGTLFENFVQQTSETNLLMTHVSMKYDYRDRVYPQYENIASVLDRSYFIGSMADGIKDNFNLILGISSVLIFVVLLISYGRLELAILAFLPMCISWILILGFMALFNIEFNIISIILSTFIFGIGDDFSIFVLDGLIGDYKSKKKSLLMHKTAIFFSALMTVLGMGVLILAKHPAIHSLGLVSLLGIVVVVLVSYILQPLLFRIFITGEAFKLGLPHTIGSFLRTVVTFLFIGVNCIVFPLIMLSSLCLPIKLEKKRKLFRFLLKVLAKTILNIVIGSNFTIKKNGEDFKKPAIIVSNHQSLVDLLMAFSVTSSMVVVTQGWVFKSPLFGIIVRMAGYLPANSGIDNIDDKVKEAVENGLSVLIFPEGTRSKDLKVHRFHKGAFYFAEKYNVDILPAVIYGSGMIFAKNQPQYVANGILTMEFLPRITPDDTRFGEDIKQKSKNIRAYIIEYLEKMKVKYDTPDNSYYRSALMKQYVFKDRNIEYSVLFDAIKNNWYKDIVNKIGRDATVLDLNTEYGALALMLSMTSENRKVYAYSSSEEDYLVAENSYYGKKIKFFSEFNEMNDFPMFDYIVLHTKGKVISSDEQQLLDKFTPLLNEGGEIIIF